MVQNPNSAMATGIWTLESFRQLLWFRTKTVFEKLDHATIKGFPINARVMQFELEGTENIPNNGNFRVVWNFVMQFPAALYATDRIVFDAPSRYNLALHDGHCDNYQLLMGSLDMGNATTCKTPCYHETTCKNSTMTWILKKCPMYRGVQVDRASLCLPERTVLRWSISTTNPPETPPRNYFFVQHIAPPPGNQVLSSSTIPAYAIVPQLLA